VPGRTEMDERAACDLCGRGTFAEATDIGRVRSNVREFRDETFTVWRCNACGSIHSLEQIDYARYYANYPLQRQKLDWFARTLFASRLRILLRAGFERHHSLLDYGCGNGAFVRFLIERGYRLAVGYDPYSQGNCDRSVLDRPYDFVAAQDVIEHVPDPKALVCDLSRLVARPGGVLALGTPNADHIDLHRGLDAVGQLHQPHHRHIFSEKQLRAVVEEARLRVDRVFRRFYVDTPLPFANSRFLFRYMEAIDGTVDAGFDPIALRRVLTSPRLLFFGLLGGWLPPKKDMLVIARAIPDHVPETKTGA